MFRGFQSHCGQITNVLFLLFLFLLIIEISACITYNSLELLIMNGLALRISQTGGKKIKKSLGYAPLDVSSYFKQNLRK